MIKKLLNLLTGASFRLYIGGGGGGQQAPQTPTTQTVQQTNLPAWAQPYSEQLLGKAQALTDVNQNPYQTYGGDRLAGFTPMQQQAFGNIANMQVSPQTGQATGLAGMAGLGGLGAGQDYMNMATSPAATQAFMSPYMQNVVDWQKQQAIMDYGRQLPGIGASAAQQGAFGGSRHGLVESEAQRNLQNTLAGIQATGSQNAFNAAQQAQQFGANLGLQGLQTAGQAAQTLGQLGQQQYGQQMGINAAQQQAGAQQQALQQQALTNQYQDFLNRQNYPYQQLAFMSDILHGTPTGGITTAQQYQATPSMFSQIAGLGLGLGALGKSGLFGKEGGSVPGGLKKYAEGGAVDDTEHYLNGGITGAPGIDLVDPTTALASRHGLVPLPTALALLELSKPKAETSQRTVVDDLAQQALATLPVKKDMFTAADGGIVAFDDGGDVDAYNVASGESWLGQGLQRGKAALKDVAGLLTLQPWSTDPARVAQGDYRTNAEVTGYTPASYAVNDRSEMLRQRIAQQAAQQAPSAPRQAFDPMNPWSRVGLPAAVPVATQTATTKPITDYGDEGARLRSRYGEAPAISAPKEKSVTASQAQATPTTTTSKPAAAANDEVTEYFKKYIAAEPKDDLEQQAAGYMKILDEKMPSQAKDIREFYKAEGERLRGEGNKDRLIALAMGGFAIAAGKSPYAIQNFGEGLGLAAKEISAINKEMRAAERERQKAERAELAADRAQEAGKFKEARNWALESSKLRETQNQHKMQAFHYMATHLDTKEQTASRERTAQLERDTQLKIASMREAAIKSGQFNLGQRMYEEFNAAKTPQEQAAVLDKYKNFYAVSGKTSGADAQTIAARKAMAVEAVKALDSNKAFRKGTPQQQAQMRKDIMQEYGFGVEGDSAGGGNVVDFSKLPK
jgi:hypothetical protein